MINKITLSKLRNPEFAQFMSDGLGLIKRNDPAALLVEAEYNALKADNEALMALLNPKKGSTLTTQVEAADDRRDHPITGINLVVTGYTYHFDPTIQAHARTLLANLNRYGGGSLARENYQSETADVSSMLADWTTKPELAAAITALNLDSWKAELAAANEAFSEVYLDRTEETSAADPVSIRARRLIMAPKYYELRNMIAGYYTIRKGAEPYATAVNQLNALIAKYNQLLANRKGGSATSPPTAAPDTPDTPE